MIIVVGQRIALGRIHKRQTVTVLVCDTTLSVEIDDGGTRVIRRTTTQRVCSIKGQRPRTATSRSSTTCRTLFCVTVVLLHVTDHADLPHPALDLSCPVANEPVLAVERLGARIGIGDPERRRLRGVDDGLQQG